MRGVLRTVNQVCRDISDLELWQMLEDMHNRASHQSSLLQCFVAEVIATEHKNGKPVVLDP